MQEVLCQSLLSNVCVHVHWTLHGVRLVLHPLVSSLTIAALLLFSLCFSTCLGNPFSEADYSLFQHFCYLELSVAVR